MAVFRLAAFSLDVTPPIGHPLSGGWISPASRIEDPLSARGLVLSGGEAPVVICAVDWCELRGEAHDAWRTALAAGAGTTPNHVLVSAVHQHDAPIMDTAAQRLLASRRAASPLCDNAWHEAVLRRVVEAVGAGMARARPIDRVGTGRGRVAEVASTRRMLGVDGRVTKVRYSAERDAEARRYPEGTIDPYLLSLSFWHGDEPVAVLHEYAVHPMSHYGQGVVSSEFVGLARERRQADDPRVAQVYLTGCAGNLGAGKYNDGSPEQRPLLAQRVYDAMRAAWEATETVPLERIAFRSTRVHLPPKPEPAFQKEAFLRLLDDPTARHVARARGAMGLAWLQRAERGEGILVPAVDVGAAQVVQLPGEPFVEYQIAAQAMRPDQLVLCAGYGDCGPGYVPVAEAYDEGGYEPGEWCFVAPGADAELRRALRAVLCPQ